MMVKIYESLNDFYLFLKKERNFSNNTIKSYMTDLNNLKSFLMTITMILIKYQENKSEPFYPQRLIKNFQIEQLQEDLLL